MEDFKQVFLNGSEKNKASIIKPLFLAEDEDAHKFGFLNILNHLVENYQIDELNRKIINTIFNYFTGNIQFCSENNISLNKGLLICGGVGTGKSILLKAFKIYTSEILKMNSFIFYDSSEIIDNVNVSGIGTLEKFSHNMQGHTAKPITCYIDDIVSKNEIVKNFGTEISVIEQLISIRYNVFTRYRKLTHFSTNIYPAEMNSFYDLRIIDRLKEMCNIIELPGESRRK